MKKVDEKSYKDYIILTQPLTKSENNKPLKSVFEKATKLPNTKHDPKCYPHLFFNIKDSLVSFRPIWNHGLT